MQRDDSAADGASSGRFLMSIVVGFAVECGDPLNSNVAAYIREAFAIATKSLQSFSPQLAAMQDQAQPCSDVVLAR